MLEYKGKADDDRLTLERLLKESIITGNKHKAEKITTQAYQRMYHNAGRVNNHEITLGEGWSYHRAFCAECTEYGIKRGDAFEREEYLRIVNELKQQEVEKYV